MPQSTPRAFEPRDITRIRFVSDAQLSPDGRRVAFVVTTLSEEKDEYLSNVWLVDVDGGEPRRLTTGPRRDTTPRWSPDGRTIAFLSEREAKKKAQLYVIPADGGEAIRLTDVKEAAADPAWSPDGARLAFTTRVGGWQEPEDEAERGKSKPPRVISTIKYKSNGEGFVYDRRSHVFVVASDGSTPPRQVTAGDFDDASPSWSPNGGSIAFVSARHETRDLDAAADVWLVEADAPDGIYPEPRRLTDTAGPIRIARFAPDGRSVAYVGHEDPRVANARNFRVYTVPVGGGAPACLTAGLDRTVLPTASTPQVAWAGDGEWLVFTADDEGTWPVYRVRADGAGAPERIVAGERTVQSLSAAGDLIAFTAADPTAPAELFVARIDGSGERRLTELNSEWRREVALMRPERIRFERAGFPIDVWVMKPFGFEEGRRYPALLNVHGGPATQYGHTFFDEFAVYAGAGYGVVYCNPRGSQGYGEAFSTAVLGDYGGGDYADVMAALDEALRRCAWIDPERLGVMGGSYGGYMTSWTVAHTDRFKAACSERALNDFRSFYGTSDIGALFGETQVGCPPWERPEEYAAHSPLSYAANIRTPLLIMHGEEDLRCPVDQAEQLFVALKRMGRETLFVRFPGAHHEMSRSGRPRQRLERFRIILDWFGRYLPVGR